ncbi:MAG: hypothetical protein D6767_06980 [Candidatus Hydrogenedentota bacterium]|nr:MAG: hypothetical protein D6767_06980 [Candidatus Hydrogenedentota bacterium]
MQNSPQKVDYAVEGSPVSSFKVTLIPFSFSVGIILLLEILLVSAAGLWGYLSLQEAIRSHEKAFFRAGRQLVAAISASAELAEKHNDFAPLSISFGKMVNDFRNKVETASVSEVFYLSADGRVLAHSDPTFVQSAKRKTKKRKKVKNKVKLAQLSELELKYNNEFFHAALLTDSEEILVRNYPYPVFDRKLDASFLAEALMPADIQYSVDFSTVVMRGFRKTGSVHVIMNRAALYDTVEHLVSRFWIMLAIVCTAGLIVGLILLFAFAVRGRFLERLWIKFLSDIDNKRVLETKISSIENKVQEMERQKLVTVDKEGDSEEILEAIYIEEKTE